ncbi:uncharacterized protein DEA37_0009958 [Paragonimus westermani]|uniref:Uncharacterized protein n=1 Tax=Paragonimus westermani TaxID=34504 RepID=A0A5J4NT43_9TREM|nr:uncharacterized protein DEA37_0009958 [Paragonimus westermani]
MLAVCRRYKADPGFIGLDRSPKGRSETLRVDITVGSTAERSQKSYPRQSCQVNAQVPEVHVKLGQIANFVIQQQSRPSTGSASTAGDQTLLIDLAGRPDLMWAARKAVSQFLESTKGGTGGTQLDSAGPSAFTVRLRTVVTRETREGLIQQGHEMLNQVKREMDRIYQTHDKLIHANADARKRFSEDHLFLARDYLRALVKQQHAVATSVWEIKEIELKAD